MSPWNQYVSSELSDLYEIMETGHAAAILANEFPDQFDQLTKTLLEIRIRQSMIHQEGGNESPIPKLFSEHFIKAGWKKEAKLSAKLTVDDVVVSSDTHKIDYVNGRIALDLEWNSKDQTFDRDLFAFRTFHEFGKISVGVLITRGHEMAPYFKREGWARNLDGTFVLDPRTGKPKSLAAKYGASTTHLGKLIYRLEAKRQGGCPLLIFGITPRIVVEDLPSLGDA